jgi:thermitase
MKKGFVALAATALTVAFAPAANADDFVPGQVIVKYKGAASAGQVASAESSAGVLNELSRVRGVGADVVSVAGGVKAAADRLEASPAVAYAEPNYIYQATAVPNDPMFGQLYGMNKIQAPAGWDLLGLGSFPLTGGVKVGIVDTGITQNHEDLVGKTADCGGVNNFGISLGVIILGSDPTIVNGKCADDNGHGTHVAGTIAAVANNGKGVAGVAFNSPLTICKALNGSGSGTLQMVANCIAWTNQHGAKIISMSLGGSGSATLQAAVTNATNNGSLLIAAAGNSGDSTVSYPAGYPEVVSVAATDANDQKASFSSFNSDVEVAAPGVNITSTWNNGAYNTISGTSMATPHASGVAALIAGRNPTGGPAAWRAKLDASVDDLGAPGRDPQFGFGRVNVVKAAQ